jgi:murein DD-endopeptidase MepM/ murein hydrolase activator NlpD
MPIKRLMVLAVLGTALTMLVSIAPLARADDPIGIPTLLPSASPSPSASSSPKPSSKPKPKPKPSASPQPQATSGPKTTGPAPTPYDGKISSALEYWRGLPKSASRTTTRLLELLQQLQPGGQPLTSQAIMQGVGNFPVAGYTWYQFDFAAPRYVPYFHLHEGNDLFSQSGTPVVACANGVVAKIANGSIGGVSIWLQADDGLVYYYGHLRSWAPGIRPGVRVKTGDFLGSVGNTGVAVGTYPHLHFEIHPFMGGPPLNPKPVLDAWLDHAEANAAALLRGVTFAAGSPAVGAARWQAILALLAQPAAEPAPLWAPALDPGATTESFAGFALDRIAIEIDWLEIAERSAAAELASTESAASVEQALAAPGEWLRQTNGGSRLASLRPSGGF